MPSPASLALLAVAVGLVGNLATNLVVVDRSWWRPVVFGTLGLLVAVVLVLETVRHRAERIRKQLDPVREQARVFGAIPRPAWRWQPRPVQEKQVRDAMGRRGRAALVALPGARGAGKSQLAAGYARWCLENGFELVAWINAELGPVPELALLAAHLQLPGAGEAEPEHTAAAVCRWLQNDGKARRLLVFDNVTDPDALRPYLPATGTTKVLITTNRQEFTAMAGVTPVPVGMFTPRQGEQFLSRATGRAGDGDSARLGMELGWLPLGLAQAAAFIARTKVSYAEYLRLLAGQDVDEALRRQAGSDHPGVLQAVRLAVAELATMDPGGDAVRLLRVLSLLSPDGVSRDLLVQAEQRLGLASGLWVVVDVLVEASLVTISGDLPATGLGDERRIVVHRLTALVIRHQAGRPPRDDLQAALDTTAEMIDELTDRFPQQQAARRRGELDELTAHLDAVLTHAGEPSPLLLVQADWIARLLQQSGDLTRASSLFERTLTDRHRVLGEDHPDTLASRNNLAGAYESAGRLTEAITLFEQTLTDRQRVFGEDHPATLSSRNNLAYAYRSAGRLTEAISLFERTLTDRQQVLGEDHPATLSSRNNLAYAYESAGRLTEAISLYERTLTDRQQVLGEDHPDTLSSRNNLAGAYESAGRLAEAISLYERTLSDSEQVLGEDHPDTLISRNNLAGAYESAGRLAEAISLYERTLSDSEQVLDEDHPDTLSSRNNLAYAYRSAGRLAEAITLFERTLTDRQRVLGEDHPDTLTSRNNLAYAYELEGRLAEAITLFERTLTDRQRVLGDDHPATLSSCNNLAYAYESAGRLAEAITLYERTLSDSERILGNDHPDTLFSRNNLEAARAKSV